GAGEREAHVVDVHGQGWSGAGIAAEGPRPVGGEGVAEADIREESPVTTITTEVGLQGAARRPPHHEVLGVGRDRGVDVRVAVVRSGRQNIYRPREVEALDTDPERRGGERWGEHQQDSRLLPGC